MAAAQVLRSVRSAPRNKRAVAVAMIDSQKDVRSAFGLGAHFVLHKPITVERARSSFRAARALMKCERRRNARVAIEIPVSFLTGKSAGQQKIVTLDLGEGGMAIKLPRRARPRGPVRVRFTLSGADHVIECPAEVAWESDSSQTGMRFLELTREDRNQLREWLNRHAPELEPQDPPVPCQLTDLSQGGCYVKTTTPFPAQTRVVLIMRQGESRVHVDAVVRVMHLDFGMGLEFAQNTEQQRQQAEQFQRSLANAKGTLPEMEVEPEGIDDTEVSSSASTPSEPDPLLGLLRRGGNLSAESFQSELHSLRSSRKQASQAAYA